ncbi:hypothetical protein LTR29_018104 [Friedmanniomyces endolithicus]|nr:hypothetical protein LTR29_018104 [Friedmanniomyces endolithicus]
MAPETIRRRYSAMFNGHPPFAYENTDDSRYPAVPYCRSQSPSPGCQYQRNSSQGYSPHASPPIVVTLDHDQATIERMSPRDVAPALYSSPRLSPAKAAELVRQDQEAFDQIEFPNLPELVDDTNCKSPLALETLGTDEETPTATGVRAYKFLHCPQCDSILKWMFVKQSKDGLHQIQGCAPACTCKEQSTSQHLGQDGPVQVGRGAW